MSRLVQIVTIPDSTEFDDVDLLNVSRWISAGLFKSSEAVYVDNYLLYLEYTGKTSRPIQNILLSRMENASSSSSRVYKEFNFKIAFEDFMKDIDFREESIRYDKHAYLITQEKYLTEVHKVIEELGHTFEDIEPEDILHTNI